MHGGALGNAVITFPSYTVLLIILIFIFVWLWFIFSFAWFYMFITFPAQSSAHVYILFQDIILVMHPASCTFPRELFWSLSSVCPGLSLGHHPRLPFAYILLTVTHVFPFLVLYLSLVKHSCSTKYLPKRGTLEVSILSHFTSENLSILGCKSFCFRM